MMSEAVKENITIWHREDTFYPVEMMPPDVCGKSVEDQVLEHVALNPGTVRVDDFEGNPIWKVTSDE